MSDTTRAAAQTYHRAWAHGNGADEMRPVMAEDFTFTFGETVIQGREAFLAGGGWPEAEIEMVAEAYDGDTGFQLYECTAGDKSLRMCERFIVQDGLIKSAEVIVDSVAFGAFMAAGKE